MMIRKLLLIEWDRANFIKNKSEVFVLEFDVFSKLKKTFTFSESSKTFLLMQRKHFQSWKFFRFKFFSCVDAWRSINRRSQRALEQLPKLDLAHSKCGFQKLSQNFALNSKPFLSYLYLSFMVNSCDQGSARKFSTRVFSTRR